MSNQNKPGRHTPDFRDSAVKQAVENDQPMAKTAEALGSMRIRCIPGSASFTSHTRIKLVGSRKNISMMS